MKKTTTECIGFCGVDSGQLMITDPCYLRDFVSDEFDADKHEEGKYSYNGACQTTMRKDHGGPLKFPMGHEGAGVAFSTGGDGTFPVNAVYDGEGNIVKIEIIINQEEDESTSD